MNSTYELKNKLDELVNKSEIIFIVGHNDPDFDAIGSAIGLQRLCTYLGKKSYIIIDDNDINPGVKKIIGEVHNSYNIINKEKLSNLKKDNSLLIMTDVNKDYLIPLKEEIDDFNNILIIDHHKEDKNTVNTENKYIKINKSSASEIVSSIYSFYPDKIMDSKTANYLLSGIVLDTNRFRKNTTEKTLNIAKKLVRKGAKLEFVEELFLEEYEDDKKIYACGCNKGGGFNSTPRATFTDDTKINKNKDSDVTNKFINFATGNCDSTLLLNENGELLGIGNNEEKIFGFEEETKIKYPKKLDMKVWSKKKEEEKDEDKDENINEIKGEEKIGKIKSFYIGYKNSYIINEEGKLFGLGNNEYYQISSDDNKISYEIWKNIPLPENCTRFIDAAVGECYLLCLVEDKEGNNKLFARGKNDNHQCGISDKEKNVRYLTMCDNVQNLNFKKIYARNKESAAVTIDGDLYVLNETCQQFTLVLFNEKNAIENKNDKNEINEIKIENNYINDKKVIVDDVAISLSHILIIARKYDEEKGVYIRKLFGSGCNSKGALGLPINSNKDENTIMSIREIPLLDENNKKLVPIKLAIGDNKSYVLCLNEEELIQNIKNNKDKEKTQYSINISNISIEREEKNILDFYYSKNVELFILSATKRNEEIDQKEYWLDQYAPFFHKENRIILSREANDMMETSVLKAEYLQNYKRDDSLIMVIDDDPKNLKDIHKYNEDIILLKDTVLID